jgi:hypothetical protein
MEAMLSEFDYFNPPVVQSSLVGEYDDMISPVNAINADAANALNTIEFNIPGANDLYRDLNNSYLMLKIKLTAANGGNNAADVAIAPVNLPLHSLFASVSMTMCGKEITEKDTLYPYRAYLETLLSYDPNVLATRFRCEGWAKDDGEEMDSIALALVDAHPPNSGFVARNQLVRASRTCVLVGRPHLDMFHQNLNIPPNCNISLKFVPGPTAFSLMAAHDNTCKIALLEAKLFVRTKKGCPDLLLAHKEMLQKGNMRFPHNRVTVNKYGIAQGFQTATIPLNFPSKLPKRVFIGFVTNAASAGTLNLNPFNFANMGVQDISLSVNGVPTPATGLQVDYEHDNYQRAYLSTLEALELDNGNRAIDLTYSDFGSGFAIYGFKIAPGPADCTVIATANSVGSIVVNVRFAAALAAGVDMIVYAETPAVLEIDKLSCVSIV